MIGCVLCSLVDFYSILKISLARFVRRCEYGFSSVVLRDNLDLSIIVVVIL